MWNLNYDSKNELVKVLEENGLSMSKKFGQNFLLDKNLREMIASKIADGDVKTTFEIGPGLGSITALVLQKGISVKAFEIDYGFCKILKEQAFGDEEGFTLIEGDALKTLSKEKEIPDCIYGNLPYNVGSVIIAKIIEENNLPEKMVFTLQKEVVERMVAKPNSKNFSSFSLLCQLDYENTYVGTLSKSCFYPIPNVESAVVVMKKREESLIPAQLRPIFLRLNRELFSNRRKTVKNNLQTSFVGNYGKEGVDFVLKLAGLTGTERVETFTFSTWLKLTRAVAGL